MYGRMIVTLLMATWTGWTLEWMHGEEVPAGERRILYNSDGGEAFADFWTAAAPLEEIDGARMKTIMENSVDEMAKVGVNTLATCVWDRFQTMAPSQVCPDLMQKYLAPREAGLDPLETIIGRCHQRGIEFLACLRMNDRHRGGDVANKGQFIRDNPQWLLEGAPGGMDYAQPQVREQVLQFIGELLDRYEVDGIEFDYMRWCHMFEPGEGSQHANVLTDFVDKTRKLLTKASQRRKCGRLVLGVRVPQTLRECHYLGFDVATWVRKGLIDYVVPTDFFYTDPNTNIRDFVKLAQGTACKIYPAIHPMICEGNRPDLNSPANYRAVARNFYAIGADGIETYNYQYHWAGNHAAGYPGPAYMWPAALGYLRELRDPKLIAQRDRHYRFYQIWERKSPVGVVKDQRIKLHRGQSDLQDHRYFYLAEDLNDPSLRATLQFKAVGLTKKEALEIQLNGVKVPSRYIIRKFDEDGQNKWQGRPLEAFCWYMIDLNWENSDRPIVCGDNEIRVHLTSTVGGRGDLVEVCELEVYVYVSS